MINFLIFPYRIKAFSRKLKSFHLSLQGLTIDVGGGSRPNPLADIIVEPLIGDNSHRQGRLFKSLGKFCIVADADNMPFKNKAINHITCSHVLEHVKNPKKVLSEFSRVSEGGYIEVPSFESELFFDREDHLWVAKRNLKNQNHLEFYKKNKMCKNDLHKLITNYPGSFYLLYFQAFEYFNLSIYWKKFIDCSQSHEINEITHHESSRFFKDPMTIHFLNILLTFFLIKVKSIFFGRLQLKDIVNIMRCLECHSENLTLNINGNQIECQDCHSKMKVSQNIIYPQQKNA